MFIAINCILQFTTTYKCVGATQEHFSERERGQDKGHKWDHLSLIANSNLTKKIKQLQIQNATKTDILKKWEISHIVRKLSTPCGKRLGFLLQFIYLKSFKIFATNSNSSLFKWSNWIAFSKLKISFSIYLLPAIWASNYILLIKKFARNFFVT